MMLRLIPQPIVRLHRRVEARLWTGRAGHLLGGSLDIAVALARYQLLTRKRGRTSR
jgi:hypothetical protein